MNPWLLAGGGALLAGILYEQMPSVGTPLLVLLVLGMLVYGKKVGSF